MRFLIFTLLATPFSLFAQQPEWLASWPVAYSLNPALPGHVMASSSNGHLMAARMVTGSLAFGLDVFGECAVTRLDPATGQALWSCTLADSVLVESGAVDNDGNIYVAGRYMTDMSICDGPVLGNTGGQFNVDLFLIKFSSDGLVLWTRNLSTVVPDGSTVPAVAIDHAGKAWYATTDFMLARFARVDENGNDVETRFIDGGKTIGGLAFDDNGAMYVSGGCDNNAFAFGGINPPLPPNDFYLMFLARYRPDGSGDWARFAHDITFQHPSVAVDDLGNVVIAGGLFDSTNWGGIPFNGPDWGTSTFIAKADSTGQFAWGVHSDPPGGPIMGDLEPAARQCVAVDQDGNIYFTGTLRGQVDWGNAVVSNGLTLGVRTQTVVAFHPDGAPLWASTSLPLTGFTNSMDIACFADGTVFFTAHVNGGYEFTPHSTNTGGLQAMIIGRIDPLSSGMSTSVERAQLDVWPVPATGIIRIFNPSQEAVSARLIDVHGATIRELLLFAGTNIMDLSAAPVGVFTLVTALGQQARIVKD